MKKVVPSIAPSFRFTTSAGQVLIYRIKEIEALATQQLREGTGSRSVLTSALALLTMACEGVQG
jgi:hypothetical protein